MELEVKNINIEEILFSGACFRCTKEDDGSITNILKDRVVNLKQDGNKIIIKSSNNDNLKEIIYDYFDLNRDYNKINKELINKNDDLNNMINKCKNYRILNQDSFEMCISYIISQNNNVKRISNSINEFCKRYGKKVIFNNKDYYLFPKYEDIKNIKVEELRSLGIGFRDKYVRDFLDKYPTISDVSKISTEDALEVLMSVKGIGLKVASCILLFGYKRLDVFPIDTWVKQYMVNHYNIKNDMKTIEKYAKDHFGEYSGLVIQYMFHSQRNKED
jgi:N-glycosylase/DNA lyase